MIDNNPLETRRIPLADAAETFPPPEWEAAWIWSAEPTEGRHDYVYFRREFELDSAEGPILIRIAADREASLWINGALIGHGPPVSDPRYKRYETHDITSLAVKGVNCAAVRVYHDTGCPFTDHAEARGLLCQIEVRGEVIEATDETWRAHVCRAYRKPGPHLGDSMWPEVFDANLDTPGWRETGYDDTGWQPAKRVIAPVHPLWNETQPQARFSPWVNLIPCETRPLVRKKHHPAEVRRVGEVIQRREATSHDTAVRMSLEPVLDLEKACVSGAEHLVSGSGTAAVRNSSMTESYSTFDGLRNAVIVFDFGKLMNARFGFRIQASSGIFDIGYAYRLEDDRVVPYVSTRTAIADQYTARQGDQTWETADWRHFRYVQLTFRDLSDELIIEEVWAEEIRNRFEYRGNFKSSDEKLDRMFTIVRRTAELSVIDRTMDNPSRERRQYLGDCSGIVGALTSCFGDSALLHRYFFNAAEGQKPTGEFAHSYPGHTRCVPSLFDHALSLPLRLREHYSLFADRSLVKRMWPAVSRLMELAVSCLDSEHMMALPPTCIWFDWGHMDRRGYFLPLQAMTAEAMRSSAVLAEAAGESGSRWSETAERMIGQIPRWFDRERGVFVDSIVEGAQQAHFSEHGVSLVSVWNLAPDSMIQSCLDLWEKNPEDFGQTSPAWAYLPAGFVRAGRPELAVRWMHTRFDQLERAGLDTWPETWCLYGERTTGTWRCRNSRAVAQGAGLGLAAALLQDMCGMRPAEPGFAQVHITPRPGPLTALRGTLPGPDGDYTAALELRDAIWRMEITLPSPRRVMLDIPFAPGIDTVEINGKKTEADSSRTMPAGITAARFIWDADTSSEIYIPDPDKPAFSLSELYSSTSRKP